MPWSKQSITINGEKIDAMAKIANGTGSIELPFDKDKKYNLDDKVKVGNADFYVRAVISRHDELTVLDIVQIKKNKVKEKKEIEIKDDTGEIW